MANPKEVLSPDDYSNYRNVRAVCLFYIVFGSIRVLAGVAVALDADTRSKKGMHPVVPAGIMFVGFAGTIGGFAALRGNRRWAPLVYVMATLYLFVFPLGTILSIAMFKGLSRYLDSVQRLKAPMDPKIDQRPTARRRVARPE